MTEIILAIVIGILCGLLVWQEKQNRQERSRLTNIIISRNITDLQNLETMDKMPIDKQNIVKLENDLVPLDQLSDEDFIKTVNKEANG
jgi:hypothetical protein